MDDSDEVIILIFVSVGFGVLIVSAILSGLVLNFNDRFHFTILLGELIAMGILAAGILKMKNDLSW